MTSYDHARTARRLFAALPKCGGQVLRQVSGSGLAFQQNIGLQDLTPIAYAGYAFGLALATFALHASGIAAALALRARPRWLRIAAAPVAIAGLAMLVARLQ